MDVDFSKPFNKQFEKLPKKSQERARSTLALFLQDTNAASLRNHALKGEWEGYRSISAGGDLRMHFRIITKNKMLFVAVGTHNQLYN